MAHFYGKIQGNRGEATRMGSRGSGFRAVAASWDGSVRTDLWHDEEKDEDWCHVWLDAWHGKGVLRTLYRGPVGRYAPNGVDPAEV